MRLARLVLLCLAALVLTGSVQARVAAAPAAPQGLPRVPAAPERGGHARVRAHAVLLLAAGPRRRSLRVRALQERRLHRGGHVLVGREAEDAGGLRARRPALDDRQPVRGLRPRPRDHARRRQPVERARSGSTSAGASVPQPIQTYPGMSRWSVVDGATSYQVWFPAIRKIVGMRTNAVDHREFYAFHQQAAVTTPVSWRVRAVRNLYGKIPTGPTRPSATARGARPTRPTNPAIVDGVVAPSFAAADTTVSNAKTPALHELTPGFAFAGTRAGTGTVRRPVPGLRLQRLGLRQRHPSRLDRRARRPTSRARRGR